MKRCSLHQCAGGRGTDIKSWEPSLRPPASHTPSGRGKTSLPLRQRYYIPAVPPLAGECAVQSPRLHQKLVFVFMFDGDSGAVELMREAVCYKTYDWVGVSLGLGSDR